MYFDPTEERWLIHDKQSLAKFYFFTSPHPQIWLVLFWSLWSLSLSYLMLSWVPSKAVSVTVLSTSRFFPRTLRGLSPHTTEAFAQVISRHLGIGLTISYSCCIVLQSTLWLPDFRYSLFIWNLCKETVPWNVSFTNTSVITWLNQWKIAGPSLITLVVPW